MSRLIVVAALAAVAVGACGILDPCDEEERVVEIEWGQPWTEIQEQTLETYRRNGWDCRSDGTLRNGLGVAIGTRYVCTRCE